LNAAERRAWDTFENVRRNFLGNKRSENYVEIMELISSYHAVGCNIHFDFFLEILEPCLTSMVKGSIRIYPEWKKDTAANGTQICWLITAGCFYRRHQQKNTRDKRQ